MLILRDLLARRSSDMIAINQRPVRKAWGGGNQFILQLENYLKQQGYRVTYRLKKGIKSILLIAPRPFQNVTIDVSEIASFKKDYTYVKCVHRINQTNKGRSSSNVDNVLRRANYIADHTVFISKWIRDYEISRWFKPSKPHSVIHNGADDKIFFPNKNSRLKKRANLKIITHHWSDNWNKGFHIYQQVDDMIASGELKDFRLTVVGRWPNEINWKSASTYPPKVGQQLADTLRAHDLYLTAAVWEGGGMHHIEAAQCGLPVIYHKNGGGIPEVASRYGVEFAEDVKEALLYAKNQLTILNEKTRQHAPSGIAMCKQYAEILLS